MVYSINHVYFPAVGTLLAQDDFEETKGTVESNICKISTTVIQIQVLSAFLLKNMIPFVNMLNGISCFQLKETFTEKFMAALPSLP